MSETIKITEQLVSIESKIQLIGHYKQGSIKTLSIKTHITIYNKLFSCFVVEHNKEEVCICDNLEEAVARYNMI
jgi:hypothetical protein